MIRRLLVVVAALIIVFSALLPVMGYGLCCDDTLAIYNAVAHGISFRGLFAPYGGQVIGIGIMYKIFGLQANYYFLTLILFRFVTGVSVYWLAWVIIKKPLPSFLVALLFVVSYAGIGTAEYAHLSNIYVATTLLNIGLGLGIIYYTNKKIVLFFASATVVAVSIAAASVRVSGAILYYLFFEFLWTLTALRKFYLVIIRVGFFLGLILILKRLGSFGGDSPYHLEMMKYNAGIIFATIPSTVKHLYYFTSVYFDILSPPVVDQALQQLAYGLNLAKLISSNTVFAFLGAVMLLANWKLAKRTSKDLFFGLHFMAFLLFLIGFKIYFGNIYDPYNDVSTNSNWIFQAINVLGSGLFLFFTTDLILFLEFSKKRTQAVTTLLLMLWPMFFMVSTFLFSPRTFAFETFGNYPVSLQESYVHYYFVGAIGLYLLVAYMLFVVVKSKFLYRFRIVLFVGLVLANAASTEQFLRQQLWFRSENVLSQIVNIINQEIKVNYLHRDPIVVYFSHIDDSAVFFPYAVSEWGFGQFRYSLINHDVDLVPYFVTGPREDVEKIIGSEDFVNNHALTRAVTINDVFVFRIENGKITSETKQFRNSFLRK